jgi:hypothetical protein
MPQCAPASSHRRIDRRTELLRSIRVSDTLRARKTIRSANNPVADYAEGLCAKALNLKLANKSTTGYDGTDPNSKKIEVKARRIAKENGSRQLSAIRGIGSQHFDFLAGVLFNADFSALAGCRHRNAALCTWPQMNHQSGNPPFRTPAATGSGHGVSKFSLTGSATSSVHTRNTSRRLGPNPVLIATSAASRPRAMRILPMRR